MYYNLKSSNYDEILKIKENEIKMKQRLNNLKINKSVKLNNPIFQIKFSYRFPNLLISGDELGQITLIDSNSEKVSETHLRVNENLNTTTFQEIKPNSMIIY